MEPAEQTAVLEQLAEAVKVVVKRQQRLQPRDRKWENLGRVLELAQAALTDGSLRSDFLGRAECRTFVLGIATEDAAADNLFGSANIGAWLQLHLANKNLTHKLREQYSNKSRLAQFYRRQSISRNPELRQTFLQILESLELFDLERLHSLNILRRRPGRAKHKAKVPDAASPLSPRSRQLDLLDAVEEVRQPLAASSSHPNLPSFLVEDHSSRRRRSFPNQKDLLVNKSETELRAEAGPGHTEAGPRYTRGHVRARSDTGVITRTRGTSAGVDTYDGDVSGAWSRALPPSTGWCPRPRPHQSLLQFLSESVAGGRGGGRAELDRENAHFVLSETVISTLEQVGCEQSGLCDEVTLRGDSEAEEEEEDDEDIRALQEEIRRRRRSKKLLRTAAAARRRLSDGQTEGGTTDQSASPGYSSDTNNTEADNKLLDSGDEDFRGAEAGAGSELEDSSAECIALSLLSQLGSHRLPPADRLSWLVTRDMADQDLLPLPSSVPVDPDTEWSSSAATEIRGTLTWAPPRPQIVLTVQPAPRKRALALGGQRWRCAGCGMKVEQRYSSSFRWCHYTGKFFCTGCHSANTHVIPARIIHHWDFRPYPVSNFALQILRSMAREQVFLVQDLNPGLLRRVERLRAVAALRTQITRLARYINSCRLAEELQPEVEGVLVCDPCMYSLEDLLRTRAGDMAPQLRRVLARGLQHVRGCPLCQARGHLCTVCRDDRVIFPFTGGVYECPECYACYHRRCYDADTGCGRCWRRIMRSQAAEAVS